MAVKDFMTKRVWFVSHQKQQLQEISQILCVISSRLSVIEHDKLVGLITEGTMAEASPSKANVY